jgi:two-component system, sensor histidine kinase and response regulator
MLQKEDVKFQELFELFPDAVVLIDTTTKLPIMYNKVAYTQLEYTENEFLHLTISEYEALENPEQTAKHIENIIKNGRDDFETKHKTKYGKILDIRVTVILNMIEDKIHFLCVFRDITEQKRLQSKIEEQNRVQKELQDTIKRERDAVDFILENTVGGYWDWDLVNNTEYLSPRFKKMFGYEDHEMQNTPESWMKIIFKEDLEKTLQLFDMHVKSKGKVPFIGEVRYQHKDGSTVWVVCSGKVVEWDESGKPMRMLGSHVDITQRKAIEQSLMESEQRFSDVADASGEYIWELDAKGEYIFLTKPFEEMSGYTIQEGLGKTPFSFMPPDEVKRVGAYFMNEVAANGVPFRGLEHRSLTKEGAVIWQKVNGLPIFDESGSIVGYRGAALDISSEKKAQEELEAAKNKAESASKAKTQFLANMSHEIRTPMNAIIGLGDLLGDMLQEEKHKDILYKINTASKMLLGIINDILDYSKIEAGKLELEHKSFSLQELLDQIKVMFEQKASDKNLELYFHLKGDIPTMLYGDQLRLTQVLTNLISNSIKFTSEGFIALRVELIENIAYQKARLGFCVEDSGIGMSELQQEKLYQPFTQADSSTTRKYGGTGLGLVISKNILNAMGSEMQVQSALGRGTKFRFELAFDLVVCELADHKNDATLQKVLLVDDQKISREVLKDMLTRFQCRFDEASDGLEAIEAVKQADKENAPYDLLLIDWNMPHLNGAQTIQKLQELYETQQIRSKIPTIFMISAYAKNDIDLDAVRVDCFISKPVTPSELLDAIAEAKGGKGRERLYSAKEKAYSFKSLYVLVVEDNIINQEVIGMMLERVGITYEIASNGKEGVEKFFETKHKFDLVLMDLQMPIMSGYEATQKIREFDKTTPIVALTAAAMVEDRQRALDAGMNEHIGKPIDKTELYRVISRLTPTKLASTKTKKRSTQVLDMEYIQEIISSKERINSLLLSLKVQLQEGEFKDIAKAIEQQEKDADAKVHTLKGVSGNIGAFELCEILTRIDVKYKKDEKILQEDIQNLTQAKERLVEKLEEIQSTELEKQSTSQLSSSETLALMQEIEELLCDGIQIQEQKIEMLYKNLATIVNEDELLRWREYVDAFDFDEALELMQGWKK